MRHRVEQSRSAASAAPRLAAREERRAREDVLGAERAERGRGVAEPPARRRGRRRRRRANTRGAARAPRPRCREVLAQELRDVVGGDGRRAPSYSTARLCRLKAPRRPWVSPPRASACSKGAARPRAANSPRVRRRGGGNAALPGHCSHARAESPPPPGAGRRRSRRSATDAPTSAATAAAAAAASPPPLPPADRRGVGVGVGDAGEVPRGLLRRPPRAFEQIAHAAGGGAVAVAAVEGGVRGARGVQPGERLDERGTGEREREARRRRMRRRGGGGHRPGGRRSAATASASGQPRIVGSALAAPAGAASATSAASVPQRSASSSRCASCSSADTASSSAHRAHARAGGRRRRRRCALGVAFGRRERGGDAAHSGHEGALRLARAEQPQGDRAGAERDAQLRRRPRAAVAGGGGGGAAQSLAELRRARLEVARQPARRQAPSRGAARTARRRTRARQCRARLLPARLGAPGSDRARSARRCLACPPFSAHRPRATRRRSSARAGACASRRPRFDVGGGAGARRRGRRCCATSDVERRVTAELEERLAHALHLGGGGAGERTAGVACASRGRHDGAVDIARRQPGAPPTSSLCLVAAARRECNSTQLYQCHPSLTQSTRSLLTFRFARQ